MRRTFWLLLATTALVGCAGPDSDPVEVAERFHAFRIEEDDPGMYGLLTAADQAAITQEAFPAALPSGAMVEVLGWGDARTDSASLLNEADDTAAVVLHVTDGQKDTVRLVATRTQRKLLFLEREQVRWRVSLGLAERALLDSLATAMRKEGSPSDSATVARAKAYLAAADRHPEYARPGNVDAANALLQAAAVAEALQVQLRLTRTIDGVSFVEGQVANPTDRRIDTVVLRVSDAAGQHELFELWDIGPRDSTPIRRITRLERSPLTHTVDRLQVF